METISIVKLIKIVKINSIMDVHLKNIHIHMIYKYIYNIYVKENVYNCHNLTEF